MDNNFECKFYEEKKIDGVDCFKCKNIKYGMRSCQLKDEFCGYYEDCEYCKNQIGSEKCEECCLQNIEET